MNTTAQKYFKYINLFLITVTCALNSSNAMAADLQTSTLAAWNSCVQVTERRITSELSSPHGFLSLDFEQPPESARERRSLLSGQIVIDPVETTDSYGKTIDVPYGMLHHWRGTVFVPSVSLDSVLSRVENPKAADTKQEDVLDSRVLENTPGQLRLYLKLQRSKIVTVRYNTEHLVRYERYGADRAASRSTAVKIAEIERTGNLEREKPEGHDRGFLWKMNSYWRYQQVDGGVLIECESMTLSRSIPRVLEFMIRPLINSVARESMERTLQSLRTRLISARS